MNLHRLIGHKTLLVCLFMGPMCLSNLAQDVDSIVAKNPVTDTTVKVSTEQLAQEQMNARLEKYRTGRIAIKQQRLIDEVKGILYRVGIYLQSGIDTQAINSDIAFTNAAIQIADDGVFVNRGSTLTQRNLAVSYGIFSELTDRLEHHRENLDNYIRDLIDFRDKIDSLASDSALFLVPIDSAGRKKYYQRLEVVIKETAPVEHALSQSINSIQNLQNQIDLLVFSLRTMSQELESKRTALTAHTFYREYPNLGVKQPTDRPFSLIIRNSLAKEKLALSFYIKQNMGLILVLLILTLLATYLLVVLKGRVKEKQGVLESFKGQLILRYPMLSSIVIVFSVFQFMFIDPPFGFGFFIWLMQAIVLGFIFERFISRAWMRFWIIIVILSVLACLDNFILEASTTERWILEGLALLGLIYSINIFFRGRREELREPGIIYFVGFLGVTQLAALLFNAFGRYNLAKALSVTGYMGLLTAVLFFWTIRLINEGLGLASGIYKHPERKLFYINFEKIGQRVPTLFYVLMAFGWFVLISRNLYGVSLLYEPILSFLTTPRSLGNYTFNISSLLVFFLIMSGSVFLSQLISFFAGDSTEPAVSGDKKPKATLGSWLLLIRIIIISLGLFFAFAATGIPLDRLTIVLGALSVGIGLGLQGLVNNLVSGLIIAFEKPVNVGDIIEINNKQGIMKSIGFRSSTVNMNDGSTIIIPNGELLKDQIINWTRGKRIKRLSVVVGVAQGTELDKVQHLITEILHENNSILQYPQPTVVAKEFAGNAVNIEVFFWAGILNDHGAIKSAIISRIDSAFRAEGIRFPSPDITVRSFG